MKLYRSIILLLLAIILPACTSPSARSRDGQGHKHSYTYNVADGIVEDWETVLLEASPRTQALLGINDPDVACDITDTLKKYGITFSNQWRAAWDPRVDAIVMTNYPKEVCKTRGLISLLDNGFSIEK